MKVPSHLFDATVHFYKEVLGFPISPVSPEDPYCTVFEFGSKNLWIDCCPHLSQTETWLQIETDNASAAAEYLASQGCVRRDDIEPLPEEFNGFWISSPANVIHLIDELPGIPGES